MHIFANPSRFLSIARPLTNILLYTGLILVGASLIWGVFFGPAERLQGDTVRIIYIHVPFAWLGMAGWSGIAIASLMELIWRHPLAAHAARASALPGAVFAGICLATGSIWGRPAWGTWWVWDGRLTSMLIFFFLYLAYMALAKSYAHDPERSRLVAIFGVLGVVMLPIIRFSVDIWETQHQRSSIGVGGNSISMEFLIPLLGSALGFTLVFIAIVLIRMRTSLAENKVEAKLRRLVES